MPSVVIKPVVEIPADVTIKPYNVKTTLGRPEIIPTKIIIDIPVSYSLICNLIS